MDSGTSAYYLQLAHDKHLATSHFSRLLKEYGSAQAIRSLPVSTLENHGFDETQIALLQGQGKSSACKLIDSAWEWQSADHHYLLCYESKHYPALLREIDSAPPLLYVCGNLESLNERHIALVGSRKASFYGKKSAFWLARLLGKAGLGISSGLALGIDTKAHEGALEGGATTIAVIGTGIDRIYPAGNAALVERIVESGAIVSEFPLGTPAYASNFPRRNRIISGLSEGCLVIEATRKSGSLITARLAMEQNRDVFALPGPITSPQSAGCHWLIQQGAKLVAKPEDILEELGIEDTIGASGGRSKNAPVLTTEMSRIQKNVLTAIHDQGCLFQSLMNECAVGSQELSSELIDLEVKGLIKILGGRYYRNI